MVPFMKSVQSRMHGLKKVKKSVMIEPDVNHPVFVVFGSRKKVGKSLFLLPITKNAPEWGLI